MRLHRLIAILLLVESRGRMTAGALAEALETSVRSIYRDIAVLAESGIPLTSAPGPGGGVSLMPGYTVNLRQLHEEEVLQLFLNGMGLRPGNTEESRLKLMNALMKLGKTLPPAYQADLHKVQSRFFFDETPWWTGQAEHPFLEPLRGALLRSGKLAIGYRKVNGDISERCVRPYGMVVKQEEWYLVAYCEAAQALRTFKCGRITSLNELTETFEIPEHFSLEEYWRKQEQSFISARRKEECYPVVVRFNRSEGEDILLRKQLEITGIQEEEERMIITFNLYDYHHACTEILTLPPTAEVLQPLVLREYMRERLRQWAVMYSVT
ncbi:helix-turn-helix transcriptional regulator ['Paenibacillus yunnanensis' Narsing Rao et al. 2020]|uniref:helix-turn-helix transcriptional regulator n=1 Tax=Paenibacillus tengchongensis TaxID=2608684 RepID=UPI00124D1B04|nr:YafY family protein [Paenibacillus tengchongensis]